VENCSSERQYERVFKVIVVLQNCINLQKVVPGSYSETCHVGGQVIYIKTEVFSDEEEDKATFPAIKSEDMVSCASVHCYPHFTIIQYAYCLCHLHSYEWNLRSPFRYV
jgi:hypothetical protein